MVMRMERRRGGEILAYEERNEIMRIRKRKREEDEERKRGRR